MASCSWGMWQHSQLSQLNILSSSRVALPLESKGLEVLNLVAIVLLRKRIAILKTGEGYPYTFVLLSWVVHTMPTFHLKVSRQMGCRFDTYKIFYFTLYVSQKCSLCTVGFVCCWFLIARNLFLKLWEAFSFQMSRSLTPLSAVSWHECISVVFLEET